MYESEYAELEEMQGFSRSIIGIEYRMRNKAGLFVQDYTILQNVNIAANTVVPASAKQSARCPKPDASPALCTAAKKRPRRDDLTAGNVITLGNGQHRLSIEMKWLRAKAFAQRKMPKHVQQARDTPQNARQCTNRDISSS